MEGETSGLVERAFTRLRSREVKPWVSSQETLKVACLVAGVLQGRGCQDLVRERREGVRVLSKEGKKTAENLYQSLTESGTREELKEKIRALHEYRRQIKIQKDRDQDLEVFLQRTLASVEMRVRRQDEKAVHEHLQADFLWQPLIEEFGQRLGFRPEKYRVADQFVVNALSPAVCQRRRAVLEAVKSAGRAESEEKILEAVKAVEGNRLKDPLLAEPQSEERITRYLDRLYEGTLPLVLADLESSPQKQEKLKQVGAEKLEEATGKLERPQGRKLFDEIREWVDQFFPKLKRVAVTGFSGLAVAWLVSGCAGQLPAPSAETILSHFRAQGAEAAEQAPEDYIAEVRRVEAFLKTSPPPKDPHIEALADQKLFEEEAIPPPAFIPVEKAKESFAQPISEEEQAPEPEISEPERPAPPQLEKEVVVGQTVEPEEEQAEVRKQAFEVESERHWEEKMKEGGWAIIDVDKLAPNLQQALEEDGFEIEKERGKILVGSPSLVEKRGFCSVSALASAWKLVSPETAPTSFKEFMNFNPGKFQTLKVDETLQLEGIKVTKRNFERISDPQEFADKLQAILDNGEIPIVIMNGQFWRNGELVTAGHTMAVLSVFKDEEGKLSVLGTDSSALPGLEESAAVRNLVNYKTELGAENIGGPNMVKLTLGQGFFKYVRAGDIFIISKG